MLPAQSTIHHQRQDATAMALDSPEAVERRPVLQGVQSFQTGCPHGGNAGLAAGAA